MLSASWLSRATSTEEGRGEDDARRVNVRGVATVLALANYLKSKRLSPCSYLGMSRMLLNILTMIAEYSMWSKDIILLITDGYDLGAQAWVDAYHGHEPSSRSREAGCMRANCLT